MDLRMPGTDGLEAIRRLRELDSQRRIPIIAVSASAFEDDPRQALSAVPVTSSASPSASPTCWRSCEPVWASNTCTWKGRRTRPRSLAGLTMRPLAPGRLLLPAKTVVQLRQAASGAEYDALSRSSMP